MHHDSSSHHDVDQMQNGRVRPYMSVGGGDYVPSVREFLLEVPLFSKNKGYTDTEVAHDADVGDQQVESTTKCNMCCSVLQCVAVCCRQR